MLFFVPADQNGFREEVLARLALDVAAGRIGLYPQMLGRNSKQPEVIMVRPMAMRWARPAIARFSKIIDRLFHRRVLRGAFRKLVDGRSDVVGRPVMPGAAGRIRIVSEQDKTARARRRAGPLQRRRGIVTVAGEASRNGRSVGEGA